MSDLRVSNNFKEIVHLFYQVQREDGVLFLWQTREDGSRNMVHGRIDDINIPKRIIQLIPDQGDHFGLDRMETLFLKSEHKNLVFKMDDAVISDEYVIIKIPEEIRVQELRSEPRYKAPMSLKVGVSLHIDGVPMIAKIADLSKHGMGLFFKPEDGEKIQSGQPVVVGGFTGHQLNPGKNGKVVFKRPHKDSKTGAVKVWQVGFSMKEPFDLESLEFYYDLKEDK